MIGFNEDIAWGMTNVSHDIKDFYRIKFTDSSKQKYIYGDKILDVITHNETIKRRGEADHIERVPQTIWGPITYTSDSTDLAMHWVRASYANPNEPAVFVNSMKSKSYEEFIENTSDYVGPAQNFLCIDKSNIGIRVNGRFPAKTKGDGKFIKDGTKKEAGWTKFIPKDELPHVKNPSRGFVSSANQRSAGPEYPYYYNGTFGTYRAERINELLADQEKFDISAFKKMQVDNLSIRARDFLPIFLKTVENYKHKEYQSILKDWDYTYTADSKAGTIFYKWYYNYRRMIFDEFSSHRESMYLKYPFDWKIFELTTTDPEHMIFDDTRTEKIELRDDIIILSFVQTFEDLKEEEDLAWSSYRPVHIDHVAKISGLGSGALELSGSGDAINALRSRFGPSWRMVVGMGDAPEAYGVYPGGQSGNPASAYYKNMIQTWAEGKYYRLELQSDPEKIKATREIKIRKKQ